jgi:hypothetical protein
MQPLPLLGVGMGFISQLGRPATAEQSLCIREILVRENSEIIEIRAALQ